MDVAEIFGGSGNLLPLIESIYSAADDPALWPIALNRIADALNCRETWLTSNFSAPTASDIVCAVRTDPDALASYLNYYASVNTMAKRCDEIYAIGAVRYSHEAMPNPEFEQTELCNDFFLPNDMYYSAGCKFHLPGQPPGYLTCVRPKTSGPFGQREGIALETLIPHLRRAVMLHLQLTQLKANESGLESALDVLGQAVFGVNLQGRVVLLNRLAETLVQSGDGLMLLEGRLRPRLLEHTSDFQSLLSEAIDTAAGVGISPGGAMLLFRASGVEALRVTITPFGNQRLAGYGQLAALVFVSDPALATPRRGDLLRVLYGVTPAESRVADLLLQGLEVREISERLGTTLEATRFQVKQLLDKTDTRRQTELIRLMLGLPGESR